MKIKVSSKRLYLSKSLKYLGVKIDENLNWKDKTCDIVTMLDRTSAVLYKIRIFVGFNTWKAIYFDSHINYVNLIWNKTQIPS